LLHNVVGIAFGPTPVSAALHFVPTYAAQDKEEQSEDEGNSLQGEGNSGSEEDEDEVEAEFQEQVAGVWVVGHRACAKSIEQRFCAGKPSSGVAFIGHHS
jgi:hypothetical protein